MNNAAIGATVGAAFGCAWGIVGSFGLPPHLRTAGIVVVAVISAALIIALVVHPNTLTSTKFRGLIYGGAIAFEVIVIILGSILLQRPDLAVHPAVCRLRRRVAFYRIVEGYGPAAFSVDCRRHVRRLRGGCFSAVAPA